MVVQFNQMGSSEGGVDYWGKDRIQISVLSVMPNGHPNGEVSSPTHDNLGLILFIVAQA